MAFFILVLNLLGTLFLLLLGGFPKGPTIGFLLLNAVAFLLFVTSQEPKPIWRILIFSFVVPLEFAVIVVGAYIEGARPFVLTVKEKKEFEGLCKDAGVRLLEKPAGPVRSIAYDWDPQRFKTRPSSMFDRVEMDAKGRIHAYGGFPRPNSPEAQKKLALDFTESRPDRAGTATINPDAPYYRFPDMRTGKPYYGIDKLSADVLAFLDVDKPEELRKAPVQQGAVRYQLTLTDRRSGAVLGVQTYVVDPINKRACGANVGNTISQDAFVYDAIHR